MKANELRIGNLLYNDGVVVTIDARTIFDIWDDAGLKKYTPVTLTEGWLLKFGFIAQPSLEYSYDGLTAYEIPSWGRIVIKDGVLRTDEYYFLDGLTQEIKYVHQLQNLYFALTGEELQLK